MPELPEVEAARRAVHDHCSGRTIKNAVIADDTTVIDGVLPSELQKALVGKKLIAAHRKGKNMWFQLDSPPFPSFQFGMTGAVYIKGVSVTKYKRSAVNDEEEWPSKYSKVFIEFDDGVEMSFTDKRRFARVRLLENPEAVPPISELGPDALLGLMPEDEFINEVGKKKISIKTLLLDQSFIAGIGNWVADEVLYQARIHPLQPASTLSKESSKALYNAIKQVIEKALEVGADGNQYPENWIFHFRDKKPGKAFVDGRKVDFITVGGRTSAYVPDLQKCDGAVPGRQNSKAAGNKGSKRKNADKAEESDTDVEGSEKAKTSEQKKKGSGKTKTSLEGTKEKGKKKNTTKVTKSGISETDDEEIAVPNDDLVDIIPANKKKKTEEKATCNVAIEENPKKKGGGGKGNIEAAAQKQTKRQPRQKAAKAKSIHEEENCADAIENENNDMHSSMNNVQDSSATVAENVGGKRMRSRKTK